MVVGGKKARTAVLFLTDELCCLDLESPPELSGTTLSDHGSSTTLCVLISLKSKAAKLS